MKKFIFGIIVGALLFGGIVAAADTLNITLNPFPVLIDNEPTTVEGYNIDGYTYLKLADFKKAKLGVSFNQTENRIEITTTGDFTPITFMGMEAFNSGDDVYISVSDIIANKDTIINQILSVAQSINGKPKVIPNEFPPITYDITTYDGMEAIQVNGDWYVRHHDAQIRVNTDKYIFSEDLMKLTFITQDEALQVTIDKENKEHAVLYNNTIYYKHSMLKPLFDYMDTHPEVGASYQKAKANEEVINTYNFDDIKYYTFNDKRYVRMIDIHNIIRGQYIIWYHKESNNITISRGKRQNVIYTINPHLVEGMVYISENDFLEYVFNLSY